MCSDSIIGQACEFNDGSYFYELRAQWKDEKGQPVTRTRTVRVVPKAVIFVDLMRPDRDTNRESGQNNQEQSRAPIPPNLNVRNDRNDQSLRPFLAFWPYTR